MAALKSICKMDKEKIMAIISDPVKWAEFYLKNRNCKSRKYWKHQREDLRCQDEYIVHQDGRETGKSVSLVTHVLHYAFITMGGSALIVAPYQGHLDTLIDELEFQLENVEDLMASIAKTKTGNLKIIRKPYYRIEFSNGTVLHFRSAGPDGKAVRSLHVMRLYVDEAAYIPDRAWKALRMCLLPKGKMRIYSTPNGVRDTYYYKLTTKIPGWTKFHWPSWISPLWSKKRERELLEFYGGRDNPDWQHEIAGEHGRPAYNVFNAEQFMRCLIDIQDYWKIVITSEAFDSCNCEEEIQNRVSDILNLPKCKGIYYLGADLGYTADPSEIVLFEEIDGVLRLKLRVHTEHVSYPILADIIATMDMAYKPEALGIDNGGNGMAVVQELLTLDKFRANDLRERLYGIDFGGMTTVGYNGDKPLKKRTKEYMTSLINSALSRKKVEFPSDDIELEDQFISHTYNVTANGIIYRKGRDHIIDAVRVAFMARDMERLNEIEPMELIIKMPFAITDPIFI